ncbi:unnamed protein product [Cylicostephanus goldi]|uniref:Uncharacterized protein n=1 Tax=Cylicostephanus goldi TaxID=71465 RepID=A0A3P7P897_CYLGO|nr:unnamed protein product [Cylicostephanus goldi]
MHFRRVVPAVFKSGNGSKRNCSQASSASVFIVIESLFTQNSSYQRHIPGRFCYRIVRNHHLRLAVVGCSPLASSWT